MAMQGEECGEVLHGDVQRLQTLVPFDPAPMGAEAFQVSVLTGGKHLHKTEFVGRQFDVCRPVDRFFMAKSVAKSLLDHGYFDVVAVSEDGRRMQRDDIENPDFRLSY